MPLLPSFPSPNRFLAIPKYHPYSRRKSGATNVARSPQAESILDGQRSYLLQTSMLLSFAAAVP